MSCWSNQQSPLEKSHTCHVYHSFLNLCFNRRPIKDNAVMFVYSTLAPPSVLSNVNLQLLKGLRWCSHLTIHNAILFFVLFFCCRVSMCCPCMSGSVVIMTTPRQQKVNRGVLTTLGCAFLSLRPSIPFFLSNTDYLLTTRGAWPRVCALVLCMGIIKGTRGEEGEDGKHKEGYYVMMLESVAAWQRWRKSRRTWSFILI